MIKLKDILLEKKELDQSYIKHAAAMTDRNYHNEARWTLARGLKDKKLEQAYRNLEKLQRYIGHANETSVVRGRLDKELFKQLGRKFSNWKDAWGAL
tara:strand:+ start:289 stop:579 length:291 start_codon:yes stop_codon:yes gene_type:complete